MKKIFTIITAIIIASITLSGQSFFDVKGMIVGKTIKVSELKSKLGEPNETYESESGIDYIYKNSGFSISDSKLCFVSINDSCFPVLTLKISGGIKVGDRENDAKAKIRKYTDLEIKEFDDGVIKGFKAGGNDDWAGFHTENGIITSIGYGIDE